MLVQIHQMNNVIDLTQQQTTVRSLIKHLQDFHEPDDFIAFNAIKVEHVKQWAAEQNMYVSLSDADARTIIFDFPSYAPDIKGAVQQYLCDENNWR